MNSGKITEPQCKRSVLKWLPRNQESVIQGAGIGRDYGAMEQPEESQMVSAMATVTLPTVEPEKYAFWKALNKLESGGAVPQAIMANLLLPARGSEERIRRIVRNLSEACESYGISYIGGHTELMEELRAPVVTVVSYGYRSIADSYPNIHRVKPEQSILMVGTVALEATSMLVADYWEQLNTRYASGYLNKAKEISRDLSLHSVYHLFAACYGRKSYQADVQSWMDVSEEAYPEILYIHPLSTGGIFAGLWELGEGVGCGINVSLKSIPIQQETVEVCDYFDVNPYMTFSGGSVLVVTSQGEMLRDFLEKHGFSAIMIGQTTSQNDRIVMHENDIRYLTPPKGDDIYKMYLYGAGQSAI